MRNCALASLAILLLVTGCKTCEAPRDRAEALRRVNENLGQIDEPLQCKGLVSFKFRDADGKVRHIPLRSASLIFQPGQNLLFDVRHDTGTVAEFGSNADRYWLWIDMPDAQKMWWGSWELAEMGAAQKLAIPPNDLFDALMLRPLPLHLRGGPAPTLRMVGKDHRLVYLRVGPDGETVGQREIKLDHCEPYQPVEIIDRSVDGQITMHAYLKNYKAVSNDWPKTPRRYEVFWPMNDAEFRLDIHRAKFRAALEPEVFDFPAGWQGEAECLDAPPAAPTQE